VSKESSIKATRRFTDREEPLQALDRALLAAIEKPWCAQVLVFYGIGGIGKSTLLRHFNARVETQAERIRSSLVCLDSHEISTPLDVLLILRSTLQVPSVVFDAAVLRYWSLHGYSVSEIRNRLRQRHGFAWDLLDEFAEVAGLPLPHRLLEEALARFLPRLSLPAELDRAIKEIRQLGVEQLQAQLPSYLGLDIRQFFREGRPSVPVVLTDAYEVLAAKCGSKLHLCFFELIKKASVGLWVFGSREHLEWPESREDRMPFEARQHMLGRLSEKDCDLFLRQVPIPDANLRQEIVESAQGLPLFLDLCVDIYRQRMGSGLPPEPGEFRLAEDAVVSSFLSHLTPSARETLRLLAVPRFFDQRLFECVARDFGTGLPLTLFGGFVENSAIISVGEGLFQVHSVIRSHLRALVGRGLVQRVGSYLLEALARDPLKDAEPEYRILLFGDALSSLGLEHSDTIPHSAILDVALQLLNSGYWNEVFELMEKYASFPSRTASRERASFLVVKAMTLRRTGRLMDALENLLHASEAPDELGPHYDLCRFHVANLFRLIGDYRLAEIRYAQLIDGFTRSEPPVNLKARIERQFADMKMLRGEFSDSQRLLSGITRRRGLGVLERAETLRILGHVHRFNMFCESAQSDYVKAMGDAEDIGALGLVAKLHTNLAELAALRGDSEASKSCRRAIEENGRIGSLIEIGKARAALSIALLLEGDPKGALGEAREAQSLQREAGYLSGILFGLLAESLAIYVTGHDRLEESGLTTKLERLVSRLGVYKFLLLPVFLMSGEGERLGRLSRDIGWLDFLSTKREWERLLASLSSASNQ